jgi:DNA-binding CsgD family transcriptional regulator
LLGDERGAADALDEAERAHVLTRYFDSRLFMARAALASLRGRRPDAISAAREGVEWTAERGMVADEALLVDVWHRLDPSEDTAERLSTLARRTDSPLVHGLATHAVALVERDPRSLLQAGDELAAVTAWLAAAEAAAAASFILDDRHDDRAAKAAVRQAQEWAAHCEGARTALLDRLSAPPVLTGRELEVARLAAAGHSSKDIADRLGVSVRTVDTHLYRSYSKLGVNDRSGLAEALANS